MKLRFFILVLITTHQIFAYPIDMDLWKPVVGNSNDALRVYSHKEKKQYKLSIQTTKVHSKNWKDSKSSDVYNDVVSQKKKMLALLGIKKWRVSSQKWTPSQDVSTLEIKGQYVNSRAKKVEFHEVHEFGQSKKVQYLFTKVVE